MHKDNSFSVGRNYTPNLKSRFELRNGTRAIEVAREMGQNRQTHGEVFAPHEDNAAPGHRALRWINAHYGCFTHVRHLLF